MLSDHHEAFAYVTAPELTGAASGRRPVVVIGAGPVGLAVAIDLATRGVPVVVLDESDRVSVGSRAICWAKRTLEIWDRLGVADRMVAKGVTWQVGRVFHGDAEVYCFDLLPEGGHKMPAFINLQQYYVEQFLVERARDFPDLIELRWKNEVIGLTQDESGVELEMSTPDGRYRHTADWVVAADGARSPTRARMGLALAGQRFEERFLIADVRVEADFPNERLFWFEPTFHPGGSALLHKQPDDVYRLDFQLGPDADPEAERRPERVIPRVRAVLGETTPFELAWCSVYAFRCARLERFVHGRVIFAGDSAHVVSPFGARGGNGGIQDADNLGWKLALVARGKAPASLLDSYDEERGRGADENIEASRRTTTFMTPKTAADRRYRDGVLALARQHPFARAFLNAGRLSKPCRLAGCGLQTPAEEGHQPLPGGERVPVRSSQAGGEPGAPCCDAPILLPDGSPGWLLQALGPDFTLLHFGDPGTAAQSASLSSALEILIVTREPGCPGAVVDVEGLAHRRYNAASGTTILIRPDTHVAARFERFDPAGIAAALARATDRADSAAQVAA
ncbi:FAD-dependent oxidoreductase [uncultured Enterovirga sp.]|uniref:FAD-dependent oxidoreductase n=1 Tax=uncultured Enterovirga sp. TaxID=2026352 RepID=UPI0035CBF88F